MPRPSPGLFAILVAATLAPRATGQAPAAKAQVPNATEPPAIASIHPPVATIAGTTEWIVKGANLTPTSRWLISGDGVNVGEIAAIEGGLKVQVRVAPDASPGYRDVRVLGPSGISNLAIVRIDRLGLKPEIEPNDEPNHATPMASGIAYWGVLKAQDLDHYRITGKAGENVTIDLEAQRIGSPISPVLTVLSARGAALAQSRETRGLNHDARLSFKIPADGEYLIQVRDNQYQGGDTAAYRLTVDNTPFATGMFPLGGTRGSTVDVTVSGGNLASPRTRSITLPDAPGAMIDPGAFDGPDGPALAPMKLVAGDGPEINEAPSDSSDRSATPITLGTTANGRIGKDNEVDRYIFEAKKGVPIAVRIRAFDLGSNLDSVLTVRDANDAVLAENDDAGSDGVQRTPFALNQTAPDPDSRLVIEPKVDGPIFIEVADRYGEGGPGHGYRLEVGPSRPDFSLSLIFPNPGANNQAFGQRPRRATNPGSTGALNLKTFQTVPINLLISAEGNTGPITLRAVGLPPGVTSTPNTVRMATGTKRGRFTAEAIFIKVGPEAAGAMGEVRIEAVAKPEGSPEIVRHATASIAIDTPLANSPGARPVMRTIRSLPLKVAEVTSESPAATRPLEFRDLVIPGVLLQGGVLDIDPAITGEPVPVAALQISAKLEGAGTISRVIPGTGASPRLVHLEAAPDCLPGVRTLSVESTSADTMITRTASVIIRPPFSIRARDEPITLTDGKASEFWVELVREDGFAGPVELAIELPEGLKVAGSTTIEPGQTGMAVRLEGKIPVNGPLEVRVAGVARMPQGRVRVESTIRPRIAGVTSEIGR